MKICFPSELEVWGIGPWGLNATGFRIYGLIPIRSLKDLRSVDGLALTLVQWGTLANISAKDSKAKTKTSTVPCFLCLILF